MQSHHLLVLGVGSIGRRHAKNLHQLGCQVSCMDIRRDRLEEAAKEVPVIHQFTRLDEALSHAASFTGVVVCSPPNVHIEQSQAALELGLPVLLEEPASTDVASCGRLHLLLQQGGKLLLSYPYRWWTPVRQLKTLISAGAVGLPRHARFVISAHLANWHPRERNPVFMDKQDFGSGAILKESHFIDLMVWFFGMPERIFARIGQISGLEINSDDVVDIVASYADQFLVTVHLDLFGRPHEKHIVVTGDQGTLQCLFAPDVLRLGRTSESRWETEFFSIEQNDMFLGVAREFINILSGNIVDQTCTLEDGVKTLKVVEACKESQRTRSEVILDRTSMLDLAGPPKRTV